MHVKSVVSALALSAIFAVSGPAFAQTMFNGAELSEADLAIVTQRCELLVADAGGEKTTGDAATGAQASDSEAPDTSGSDAETTPTDAPQATDGAQSTTIDVEAITLDQCKEAGIGGAM